MANTKVTVGAEERQPFTPTVEQQQIEKMLTAHVSITFDHAVEAFKVNAGAHNYVALQRAMILAQAWQQRKSPSRMHEYGAFLDSFWHAGMGTWGDMITKFVFDGKTLAQLTGYDLGGR